MLINDAVDAFYLGIASKEDIPNVSGKAPGNNL